MNENSVSIGIDVAKNKLQIAWLKQLNPTLFKPKSLPNTPEGHRALMDWLIKNTQVKPEQLHVILEPTNVYHEQVALYLHEQGCRVSLVNPKKVNDFAASLGSLSKNDRKDSVMLARFGAMMSPRLWHPPPLEIRMLQDLLNRLDALQNTLLQEQNRLDTLSKKEAYPAIIKQSLLDSIAYLQQAIKAIQQQIDDHIDRHPHLKNDQALLETIPGIAALSAQRMIAVIRGKDFNKASEVAAFMGLVPMEHTSGSSVFKRPRLSKRGDPALRGKLYMPVIAAITHNPTVRSFYKKLIDQRKHQRAAMTAAMRKLVHICFGVLKHQQPFSLAV